MLGTRATQHIIRYPFLLVDRVVELETQKYAVGYKNITSNDQFFNGHFPERAIMPGEGAVFLSVVLLPCACSHTYINTMCIIMMYINTHSHQHT